MMNIVDNSRLHKNAVTSSVFCQDNLELLKSQPDESVDLIYCDILYGTGKNFGDFQDLKPIRSEIEAHYLPRLKEMHRVLKSTGSIYLQMDTRINHWIRCLLDEVFGYNNFRNEIIWCYSGGGRKKKDFAEKHDVIYRYSKTKNYTFNDVRIPYTIGGGTDTALKSGKIMDKNINGKVHNWKPNEEGKIPEDWWCIPFINPMSNERVGYSTQKPKALIERIVKASSNEGDLVADFYAGSFTTAEVCKELNRNFIGCDINSKAVEIGRKRLNGGVS